MPRCKERLARAAASSYVVGVDVGSTTLRCHVFDKKAAVRGSSSKKVETLYPHLGWVELDPEVLWTQFMDVIKEAVQAAGLQMNQIAGLGISTQRGTFITWNKYNKQPMKVTAALEQLTLGCYINSPKMCWSSVLSKLFSIPMSIYPPVEDTNHSFGSVDAEIFGEPIPIVALVADQQAAMFGECCFHEGDVKLTMGTGIFWDVNTGNHLHTPSAGLYPLIGWKIGKEVVFLAEGNASDAGSTIKWAKELDLFTSVDETARMARSVVDSEGVCFVPSFSGLQVPVNDPCACASFMGLKPSTTRNHLIRAMLESIAFRNKQLYDTIVKEVRVPLTNIRADGGVSNNSFIMQMTSDLINKKIDKPVNTDMSCLGAAFLAGLALGFWTDKEQLKKLRRTEIVFEPQRDFGEYKLAMDNWTKAVQRSLNWYNQTSY
ncbi:glycerol kinase 5 isoform X5 [Chelonoidis abingdonii]|uniref:glycerol kinase 5 isoform X5 n=1 Tax=Chelonoidis abingdonii TaxID=106734 RepID=UPI003F493488